MEQYIMIFRLIRFVIILLWVLDILWHMKSRSCEETLCVNWVYAAVALSAACVELAIHVSVS